MMKKITLELNARADEETRIRDELQIMSKTDIVKIPVTAHIMPPDMYEERDIEYFKMYN